MGILSEELIDEIERICRKINDPAISQSDKELLYNKLDTIYMQYFVEMISKSEDIKGS